MSRAIARDCIERCGQRVEYWLECEAAAVRAGDFNAAAESGALAEAESRLAFWFSGDRSTWACQSKLFPAPPVIPRAPLSGVAGSGGDLFESGCAGAV